MPFERVVYIPSAGRNVTLPLGYAFTDRFFPKCEGYSKRSYTDRTALYRISEYFPAEDFKEFLEQVYSVYSRLKRDGLLSEPLQSLPKGILNWVSSLHMHTHSPKSVEVKIYKTFLVSKRYCLIRSILRTSDYWLVRAIDRFYKKVDYYHLRDFYTFQQEYSSHHPASDLIHMYPEFEETYLSLPQDISCLSADGIPNAVVSNLMSFGIDVYCEKSSLESTYDYMLQKSKSEEIYKDTHKAHAIHSYINSRTFKRLDPLLQTIILDYHNFNPNSNVT